jgi:hypothetical protein
MNLFTSGLALTGLVTLPLTLGGQESQADAQPAVGTLRPALAQSAPSADAPAAEGFARFQPRGEVRSDRGQAQSARIAQTRDARQEDEARSEAARAKLEAEIARLEAEIAALTGKAAALEANDSAPRAVKLKGLAKLAETDAIHALDAGEWSELVKQQAAKVKGLKLDPRLGISAKNPQVVTWSGADGKSGYGLFDADDERVIYFEGEKGDALKLEELIAKHKPEGGAWKLRGDGDKDISTWVFGDGDSKSLVEFLDGQGETSWITEFEDDVAIFGSDGEQNFWKQLKSADDESFWAKLPEGTHRLDGDDVKVIVQGHKGQPAEVHGKVIVTGNPDGDLDEIVRLIDGLRSKSGGKLDIRVSTSDSGDVQQHELHYADGDPASPKSRTLYTTRGPGQAGVDEARAKLHDALRFHAKDDGAGEELVILKRALEQAQGSGQGGQNPFVQRVEVHNHGRTQSEHDDLRALLEAMAADLTEVRHEVKAIRALLEGGEPLGMAPTPALPGFPVRAGSAPHASDLNSTELDQIASLFGVASGARAPQPTAVGSRTVTGYPIPPVAVGQPIEPIAVGQPIAPIAVGQPIEPIAVGQPIAPVAVGQPVEPIAVGVPIGSGVPAAPPAPVGVLSLPAGLPKNAASQK